MNKEQFVKKYCIACGTQLAGIDIKPNETYIDTVCRITSLRQKALCGLSLKLTYLRLQQKDKEEADIIKEFNRLSNMTDEEYDIEVSGNIRQ